MDNQQVKAEIDALFQRLGLAIVENNRGLGLLPGPKGSWRVVLLGHMLAYERHAEDKLDARAGAHYNARTFFLAGVKNDALWISNFATSDFQFWAEWWQKRLQPGVRPLQNFADLEEVFSLLVEHLDRMLDDLIKEHTADNRIYLLNLIMARKQSWLPTLQRKQFLPEIPDLALPLLKWWNFGVPVEYTLHFFNPYIGGGFIKSGNSLFSTTVLNSKNKPAMSMTHARRAAGIPIAKLRVLYPTGAERF